MSLLVSDSAFSFAVERRRRSKKCSIFDTISENVVTKEAGYQQSAENITIPKIRKENAKYFYICPETADINFKCRNDNSIVNTRNYLAFFRSHQRKCP